ncbi:serine/threonine-protein kinase mos, partial [Asbolus verrucosus]
YDLLYFIGKGSFGTVVKGKHEGNLVAVKVIKLQNSTDKDKINEYNALNLAHENVIKTIDVIINNNEKYGLILMEYHKNSRNLQTILNDTNFSLNRSTIILNQKIFYFAIINVRFVILVILYRNLTPLQ